MRALPDNSVDLIIADPPYNIGKDKWDRVDNYHSWLLKVFKECERVLKDNGTFWYFHINFNDLSIMHELLKKHTSFRHKQLIIINKGLGSVAGRCNMEVLRSFPRATEYLQFYTFEDVTGSEMLNDEYAKMNPMAKYLKFEFERAKVNNKEIAKLFPSKTGGMTGCVSNWLLGFNFPLEEQYNKIRDYLNGEYLRKEYEDLRYTFNLPLSVTDVWDINFYNEFIDGHKTPKPVTLIKRIIQTTSKPGDIILDPFLGSGTTLRACRETGRVGLGFEIEKDYEHIIQKRMLEECPIISEDDDIW